MVAWAQLTLLWCICGTVVVPVPQSTHCPLVSMRKCSAVYIRSDGPALACLPGDFWLAWQLSLGTWWLLNNLVLHSSCLFKGALVSDTSKVAVVMKSQIWDIPVPCTELCLLGNRSCIGHTNNLKVVSYWTVDPVCWELRHHKLGLLQRF